MVAARTLDTINNSLTILRGMMRLSSADNHGGVGVTTFGHMRVEALWCRAESSKPKAGGEFGEHYHGNGSGYLFRSSSSTSTSSSSVILSDHSLRVAKSSHGIVTITSLACNCQVLES
jgi:hypothetical protein